MSAVYVTPKYRVNCSPGGFDSINRVDRETEYFWFTTEPGFRGPHESRSKKCYGDTLFDSFDAAKAVIVAEAERRLERAVALEQREVHDSYSHVSILFPLAGGS